MLATYMLRPERAKRRPSLSLAIARYHPQLARDILAAFARCPRIEQALKDDIGARARVVTSGELVHRRRRPCQSIFFVRCRSPRARDTCATFALV